MESSCLTPHAAVRFTIIPVWIPSLAGSAATIMLPSMRLLPHLPPIVLGFAVASLAMVGCGRVEVPAPPPAWTMLERPGGDRLWTADSADDHVDLDWDAVGQAGPALGARIRPTGRGKAVLRREVDWDGDRLSEVAVEVRASRACTLAVAFTTVGGGWFETAKMPLVAGWNTVACDLSQLAQGKTAAAWLAQRGRINRISLLISSDKDPVEVLVETVRGRGEGPISRTPAPQRLDLVWPELPARTGAELRWTLTIQTPLAAEPWNDSAPAAARRAATLPGVLAGELVADGPDGRERRIPGVLVGQDQDGTRRYELRWRPDAAGEWRLRIGATAGGRWRSLGERRLLVEAGPSATWVDGRLGAHLVDGAGRPVRPVACNLAWTSDPEPWFALAEANGVTLARVWLSPWHVQPFAGQRLDRLDLAAADRLDAILACAAQHKIGVVLVLGYHGLLSHDWEKNPFASANGGPCQVAEEFWTDAGARTAYRRWLDYAVARWGARPALSAWEFWNEVDLTRRWRDEDIVEWHREMARHLKRTDAHHRLITTSTAAAGKINGLWTLGDLDLIQVHAYGPHLESHLDRATALAQHGKPVWLGECGRDWRLPGEQIDRDGKFLRQALWLGTVSPHAALPAPWWWDGHLVPNGLFRLFQGPARILADGDGRRAWTPVAARLERGEAAPAQVRAVLSADRLRAYVYTPAAREPGWKGPLLPAGNRLILAGVADGPWSAVLIDPSDGAKRPATTIAACNGRLELVLPAIDEDLAVQLDRSAPAPGAELLPAP